MRRVRRVRMPVYDVEYRTGGEYLLSATSDLILLFWFLCVSVRYL